MKQRGETFFRAAQGLFALPLVGDFTNHPDHSGAAVFVREQTSADLQPMQAAIGPADAVMHRLFQRRSGDHCVEGANGFCPVFRWQQVKVFEVFGQWLARIETEQRLRPPRPADLPAFDVPVPGASLAPLSAASNCGALSQLCSE